MNTINITTQVQYDYVVGQYIDVQTFNSSIRFDVTDYPDLIPDFDNKANLERFVSILVTNPYDAYLLYKSV